MNNLQSNYFNQGFVVLNIKHVRHRRDATGALIAFDYPKEYAFLYPAEEWDKFVSKHGMGAEFINLYIIQKGTRLRRLVGHAHLMSVRNANPEDVARFRPISLVKIRKEKPNYGKA